MSYFRHGDPLDDFHELEAEPAIYESKLPICDRCHKPIHDEDYYDVDGEILHEECMIKEYRKKTQDYIDNEN